MVALVAVDNVQGDALALIAENFGEVGHGVVHNQRGGDAAVETVAGLAWKSELVGNVLLWVDGVLSKQVLIELLFPFFLDSLLMGDSRHILRNLFTHNCFIAIINDLWLFIFLWK